MRAVLQRVSAASVKIDGQVVGEIENGFVVLLGVTEGDNEEDAKYLARKIAQMRVFEDPDGKMNLAIKQVGGKVLSISQFTLYADTRKGNRPSFVKAARPELAEPLYEFFNSELRATNLIVQTGVFGADMKVSLVNDGPVTIVIDSLNN
jgi:D-tyrosyl-tRNA(Tyr) deacylase